MKADPQPKKPHKKDAEYMRKAYLYTAVLLILGVIGSLLLAERIVTAQAKMDAEAEQLEQQEAEYESEEVVD